MDTPICDFLDAYSHRNGARLHMPGHKGIGPMGVEQWDITEIEGADALYTAQGIIARSEANATALYGSARTLFSTEGCSLAIRAMVALAVRYAHQKGIPPLFLAGRNAHHAFLTAVGLCDAQVQWLYPRHNDNYMTCRLTVEDVRTALEACSTPPVAVYITAPDYLGNTAPLRQLAELCHRRGVLLLVDNAHGAYLRFVDQADHPLQAGADACCDSAHKTLPALTSCAYLHIGPSAPPCFAQQAKDALALFGSTSPSYLLLASLDKLNAYLADYAPKANAYAAQVALAKRNLAAYGYMLCGDEPYKITLSTRPFGYAGHQVAHYLRCRNIEVEMATEHYIVLMCTPNLPCDALQSVQDALLALPAANPLDDAPMQMCHPPIALPLQKAMWAPRTTLPIEKAVGRIAAALPVRCPPAVPIVIPGEIVDASVVSLLHRLGIDAIDVISR